MFLVNDDLSIYATRGDIVCLNVSATDDRTGKPYEFQPGDILQMKVYVKKDAESVVLQKDFPVPAKTNTVGVFLTEQDTKFGDVISKPTDYWYEVTLNPYTNPQTFIGYDEDGAKIFKLFPEGKDITTDEPTKPEDVPVVDADLSLISSRPVENKAISRAITLLKNDLTMVDERLTGKIKANQKSGEVIAEELAVERARIDNLVASPTPGDSELVDIRVGADGKTYESAGTAVREQFKETKEESTVNGGLSYHIEGYLDGTHGGVLPNPESAVWHSTDFGRYDGGNIYLRGVYTGNSPAGVAFYDENRVFIGCVKGLSGNVVVLEDDIPTETAYVRSCTILDESNNPALFVGLQRSVKRLSEECLKMEGIKANFFPVVNRDIPFTINGYIRATGEFAETINAWMTDYQAVAGYAKIRTKASITTDGYSVAYYDEFKTLLADVSILGGSGKLEEHDIPEGVYYVRVCHYGKLADCSATLYNKYGSYMGKRILTIGDSISAIEEGQASYDRSWKKYFNEVVMPCKLVSTAVPGACWCDFENTVYDGNPTEASNNVIGNQIEQIVRRKDTESDYADFDVIIISAGTNDIDDATNLTDADIEESFYDSGSKPITDLAMLDRTTWAGAMRYAVDTLRGLYPDAHIFICTPVQRTAHGNYSRLLAKSEAMRKITLRLGANLINSFECGVYDMTCPSGGQEGDFNDGLHLSAQGAKKLGLYNARALIQHYSVY